MDNNNNNGYSNGTTDGNDATKTKVKKSLRDLCDGTNDSDSVACSGYSKYNICKWMD